MMGNWFLLFHLIYYSLSYRIRVLTSFISQEKVQTKDFLSSVVSYNQISKMKLRKCAYIFDKISLAANELNATFSLSVLVILTIQIIISATSLFFVIFPLSLVTQNLIYSFGCLFIFSVVAIIIVLTAAESPVTEVYHSTTCDCIIIIQLSVQMKHLKESLLKISTNDDNLDFLIEVNFI